MKVETSVIPMLRAVYRDTYVNLLTSGLTEGDLAYATDREILYRWNSSAWEAITSPPLPSGLILMWHGLIANIPAGWRICDGGGGTPNLLGKFVEGVATAATNPGSTGGATAKNTAGHVHSGASHSHTVDIYLSNKTGSFLDGIETRLFIRDSAGDQEMATADTETTNVAAVGKRETTAVGGTQNTGSKTDSISDIRPIYYDIAFIMKL